MRSVRGCDDYGIACCVSYQAIGKSIQFFGARANLAKALLLALNEGRCENTGTLMVEGIKPLKSDVLDFDEVMANYQKVMHNIARVYNDTMNIIHYMHDKYDYEKSQMALIDTNPSINLAYGVAGNRSTPLLKNLRVCAVFPSSLVSAGSPRDRTLNSCRRAQPCFWHFVSQRALEHLLGWEREGSTDCTLET